MPVTRHRDRSGERGFSLILTIVVLAVVTVMVFASIDAVTGSVGTTRSDLDQKRALLAAYAGLSAYTQALDNNSNYWATTGCSSPQSNVTVPGSADDGSVEKYSWVEMVATSAPSNDNTSCDASNPVATEIESGTSAPGTFRVKFTGASQPASGTAAPTYSRSLVAQFVAQRFLNYVYFTNFEEVDPYALDPASPNTLCDVYLYEDPTRDNSTGSGGDGCTGIHFAATDVVAGPLHSNDEVTYCAGATFGRNGESPPDPIQAEAFVNESGCSGSAVWDGTEEQGPPEWSQLSLPPTNEQLLQVADGTNSASDNGCYANAGCVFQGWTEIVLGSPTSSEMQVTNAAGVTTTYTMNGSAGSGSVLAGPSNGVIYILPGSGSCVSYTPFDTDYTTADNAGCADVTVSGTYNASLTIATGDSLNSSGVAVGGDIIINNNLTTNLSSTDLLGLIATNFIRVAHPVSGTCSLGGGSATNTTSGIYSSVSNLTIDAAILSLNHSFLVDNWTCGAPLQYLYVNGAIAQDFRGAVAVESGSTITNGYTKDYQYDPRFESLSPPYFLNPVDAGWEVQRITECNGSGC
jgi:Tfp pilus assembly protein PilX